MVFHSVGVTGLATKSTPDVLTAGSISNIAVGCQWDMIGLVILEDFILPPCVLNINNVIIPLLVMMMSEMLG